MIYKVIMNHHPPRARCPRKQSLHGMSPRGPRCPVNRPPGVAGAWLLLQDLYRVSLEAGRASVGRKERTAQAAPRESPGGSPSEQEGTHSPPHTAVKESQSSSSACTQSLRFMLQLSPRQPGGAGEWAERQGTQTQRKARAGAGACGHGARVAPGPREGERPSRTAGCRPHSCSLPLLWCSLLCRREEAPRSWPRWLPVSGKNSPSG